MGQENGQSKGQRLRRRTTLTLALVALMTVPAVAFAATSRYRDVSDTSIFLADIEWLAEAGITNGCGNDEFCPEDGVTREQMAALLHRLAIGQVVDASTVKGLTPADLQGQTGPQGATGATGATGTQGDPASDGATGAQGDPGSDGATGVQGDPGSDGATGVVGVYTVQSSALSVGFGEGLTVGLFCQSGDLAIGGGFDTTNVLLIWTESYPLDSDSESWRIEGFNTDTSGSLDFTAYLRCLDVTP